MASRLIALLIGEGPIESLVPFVRKSLILPPQPPAVPEAILPLLPGSAARLPRFYPIPRIPNDPAGVSGAGNR